MVIVWLFSLKLGDASIVDLFWGFGFVLVAWVTFFVADPTMTFTLLRSNRDLAELAGALGEDRRHGREPREHDERDLLDEPRP